MSWDLNRITSKIDAIESVRCVFFPPPKKGEEIRKQQQQHNWFIIFENVNVWSCWCVFVCVRVSYTFSIQVRFSFNFFFCIPFNLRHLEIDDYRILNGVAFDCAVSSYAMRPIKTGLSIKPDEIKHIWKGNENHLRIFLSIEFLRTAASIRWCLCACVRALIRSFFFILVLCCVEPVWCSSFALLIAAKTIQKHFLECIYAL